ncbi:ribonuclease H-like protein, partial [Mycena leptocephala]
TVYIGNSYETNDDGEICSHGGVWYCEDDTRNSRIPVETGMASTTSGEAAAILHTIQDSPQEIILNFKLGSTRLIKALTTNLTANEDNDWLENNDRVILKAIVAALRGRGTRCTFQKQDVQGDPAMEMARRIASTHSDEIEIGHFQTMIPSAYDLNGVKLSTGTQRTFYRAIKSRRRRPDRAKTTMMLDRTRHAARALSGYTPTDGELWKSLNHKDISRTTSAYLWRGMHQAYKIGEYWRNIPTFEHWADCRHCMVDDSMEHILIDCEAPGREKLWELAQELWEKTGHVWPEINLGTIFACGLAHFKTSRGKRDKGADRLFRILISETAHLIWKLRCTRVIERGSDPTKYFSEKELHNRWLSCINQRLRLDILLTDRRKFGNRASNFKLVLNTWKRVIKDAENLQDIQILQSRVLVGIDPLR